MKTNVSDQLMVLTQIQDAFDRVRARLEAGETVKMSIVKHETCMYQTITDPDFVDAIMLLKESHESESVVSNWRARVNDFLWHLE